MELAPICLAIIFVIGLISFSENAFAGYSTVPDPPPSLSAYGFSPTGIDLLWVKPSDDGGESITGYKIEYKVDTGYWQVLVADTKTTATTYTHVGLTTGTTYTYRVSAINSIGASNTVQASAIPVHTQFPTNLVAYGVSPTQIDLFWKAPSQTYGGTITGYEIEEKIGLGVYEDIESTTGQETSASITGLESDTTYTFRVKARFIAGSSPYSDDVSATTASDSSPYPQPEFSIKSDRDLYTSGATVVISGKVWPLHETIPLAVTT